MSLLVLSLYMFCEGIQCATHCCKGRLACCLSKHSTRFGNLLNTFKCCRRGASRSQATVGGALSGRRAALRVRILEQLPE